jgi:hypothetical protein
MGNFFENKTENILICLRQDSNDKLKELISLYKITPNEKFTSRNRTLIQLCSYYSSPKCLETLIELKNDINICEESTNESPLFIACKFNYIKIVEILLNQTEINFSIENYNKLNCLDIAILEGNYEICYYLLNKTTMKIESSLEKYISMNMQLNFPLFDISLFYDCLKKNISPEKCPSFAIKNKKKKEFEGKVPDPNETWTDFFKRLMRLELYQPPLVDKNKVDNMNSLYMKFQTSLCEREYNIKFDRTKESIDDNNDFDDDENDDEIEKNVIFHKKKNKTMRNYYENDLSKFNEKKKLINNDSDRKNTMNNSNNSSDNNNNNDILILNINKKLK